MPDHRENHPIAILVHGGAGVIADDDDARACADGCLRAARAGYALLAAGQSAVDAVEAACVIMEDDPRYNAGTGACLNADGDIELDASIMRGQDLGAGAVATLRGFGNPIRIARAAMERGPHVFYAGEGAARFAREAGFAPSPPGLLLTEKALREWRRAKEGVPDRTGTVGAVAIDSAGHVAAATTTGGTVNKAVGRVGDTPVIGAGTYADDEGGAASATGNGEACIRVSLSRHAVDRMRAGATAEEAARSAVATLDRVGGKAGLIVVDRHGRIGFAFNTARMSRGSVDSEGRERGGFER